MPIVHIIHVIAYGFDHSSQPDQQYFLDKEGKLTAAKSKELVERLENIFANIFFCAEQHGLQRIFLSKFGRGAFAGAADAYIHDIWRKALKNTLDTWKERLKNLGVKEISFMNPGAVSNQEKTIIENAGFVTHARGYVPDAWKNLSAEERKETLFVNAWDPHSIIGNGNKGDNSLDGHIGRTTATGALGWTWTNPYLMENVYALPYAQGQAPFSSDDDNDDNELPQEKNLDWRTVLLGIGGLAGLVSLTYVGFKAWKKYKVKRKNTKKQASVLVN